MKKKYRITIIILVLVAIVVVALWYQIKRAEDLAIKRCKQECIYWTSDSLWHFKEGSGESRYLESLGRHFPTQEQCIDYCLTITH